MFCEIKVTISSTNEVISNILWKVILSSRNIDEQ